MFVVKKPSVDLGLAISGATLAPGQTRSLREIAAFCDCHYNNIEQIEKTALKKIRQRLLFGSKQHLGDDLRSLFS